MPRKTLVLLPGLLNTRRVFEHQIVALSDIAECIVPELWHYDTMGDMAEAVLAAAPPTFALAGFSMGGYVSFEILRRAPERVERLALIDTQATPDSPESIARRHGLVEQTHIGRFHGVQPSMLPHIVHRSHLDRPRHHPAHSRHGPRDRRRGLPARADGHHGAARQPAAAGRHRGAHRGDRGPPGPVDAAGPRRRRWRPTSRARGWWCSRNAGI